jgi:GDPmannose 4,6-dehydratase
MQEHLYLGNLGAKRDWGHARDYVEAQWLMLQQEKPEDFVIATGSQHSVREFIDVAADTLKMKISWKGRGVKEKGYDETGKCIVSVDPRYFRPSEVDTLLGDAGKARRKLNWKPKVSFESLVKEMAHSDLKQARDDKLIASRRRTRR